MEDVIDQHNYRRICQYLVKTNDFQSDPNNLNEMLEMAYKLYKTHIQQFEVYCV